MAPAAVSGPLWIVLAAPDGGVRQLARGSVVWDVALLEAGLPVVVQSADELRVLHDGGFFHGAAMPVPAIAAALRAAWLARGIGARLYRTPSGFARELARRRAAARALRDSGQAWAAIESQQPRLGFTAVPRLTHQSCHRSHA